MIPEEPKKNEPLPKWPRDNGTRRGGPALAILMMLGFGTGAFVTGVIGYAFHYPQSGAWVWLGAGSVTALICFVITIIIFRLTSPNRRRRK